MESVKLLDVNDLLSHAGICIPTELAVLLQNSLAILQKQNHFTKCYYWGRINGIFQDYHIAFGYKTKCLERPTFFYSTDHKNWFLLTTPKQCSLLLTPLAIGDFYGDPSVVTNVYDMNPLHPKDEETCCPIDGSIIKNLKEEDRLSATVHLINNDAVIIPRGSWLKNIDGKIVKNHSFEGLAPEEANELRSYQHARLPQNKWNSNLLVRPDYNYSIDFLDTIQDDIPENCWNLQVKHSLVILQNLSWQGMIFFHKLKTPHHGYLYVGNGRKNLDIPFSFL